MYLFWFMFAFVIGLIFGSFANVVIYRWPRKLSVVSPPSACPKCEKRLGVLDLIPIVSWLALRGRCRFCRERISLRYPAVELACGLLFASMVLYSPTLSAIPLSALAFVLLCVTMIDWDTQTIPDGLLIFGAIAGVIWIICGHFAADLFPFAPDWRDVLLGAMAGALPLFLLDRLTLLFLKKDGFGYGDVKLMAMVGLFLGWQMTLMALGFAVVFGAAFAIYLLASGKAKRGTYMAFGPFLCAGALAALWLGEPLLSAYFGLL